MEKNVKPLAPTEEQKRAIVKALDEFEDAAVSFARAGCRYKVVIAAHNALLAALGITEEEWEKM